MSGFCTLVILEAIVSKKANFNAEHIQCKSFSFISMKECIKLVLVFPTFLSDPDLCIIKSNSVFPLFFNIKYIN